MKIVINKDHLDKNEVLQKFYKVRAIIENNEGEILISFEGGKYIFPGGKRKKGESAIHAILREVKEETGICLREDSFVQVLELDTFYKDFYDYRSNCFLPRFTNTIYYYASCSEKINFDKMELTEGEQKENFTIAYVKKKQLIDLLSNHDSLTTQAVNGKFFDEENKIVVENILLNEDSIINNQNIKKKLK